MKYSVKLLALFYLSCLSSLFGQSENTIQPVKEFSINSTILNEDRTCLISLPDSYHDAHNNMSYPLIILLDGATFFKTATGTVHFMSSRINRNYLMPETIIVAIENIDRERDFTVTKLKTKRPNTMGGGNNFLDFIEKELIPYVDHRYRTLPHRTLIGHSLGGLLTLNAYMDEHRNFDAFLCIDPSIWWDEETMKRKTEMVSSSCLKKKIYMATANQGEANYARNKKRHDRLYALLNSKSNEPLQFKLEYFEHENHRSVPLLALYNGLRFLNNENE